MTLYTVGFSGLTPKSSEINVQCSCNHGTIVVIVYKKKHPQNTLTHQTNRIQIIVFYFLREGALPCILFFYLLVIVATTTTTTAVIAIISVSMTPTASSPCCATSRLNHNPRIAMGNKYMKLIYFRDKTYWRMDYMYLSPSSSFPFNS